MHKTITGLVILGLGLALLAANYNLLEFSFILSALLFWPLILMAIGLDMAWRNGPLKRPGSLLLGLFLLGYVALALAAGIYLNEDQRWRVGPYQITRQGVSLHADSTSDSLEAQALPSNTQKVTYRIGFGAGELKLDAAEAGSLLDGRHRGGQGPEVSRSGSRELEVRLQRQDWFSFPWLWGQMGQSWEIGLTPDVPIAIELDTGATDTHADFSALLVESFSLDTGASDTTITLGDLQDSISGRVNMGASSLTIRIPQDMALSLDYDGGLTDLSLPSDVTRQDGSYRSDPERDSTTELTLELDAGLGSVTIERYGEPATEDEDATTDPNDGPEPTGEAVDFTRLTSGSQAPISNVGDSPAVLSVQSYLEANPNATRLASVLEVYRQEVNYDTSLELLVLQGQQSSGGYRISVDDVRLSEDNVLQLIASMTTPRRSDIVTQVITAPFDLIAVDSEAWEAGNPPGAIQLLDESGETLHEIDWPTEDPTAE